MLDFNSILYKIVGQKIRERREESGMSQGLLAQRIPNLGRSSISNIEKGRQQAPLHILYKICNILNIDIQSLLPTYGEIESQVLSKQSDFQEIDKYINNFGLDANTLNQIKEFIKNQSDDNKL